MSVRTYDWLSCHADRTPDKTAWVDLHSNRSFTYAQANDRAARLGAYLQSKCGIKKGDRIGVLAMNSTDMFEVQFACAKIGAVYLPLNWRLTVTELTFIIEDAGPAAFVFDRAFAAEVTSFFVAPYARGHGLALGLITAIEQRARAEGYTVLELDVRASQDVAIKIIEQCGFRRWATKEKYALVDGAYVGGYYYVKDLDGDQRTEAR